MPELPNIKVTINISASDRHVAVLVLNTIITSIAKGAKEGSDDYRSEIGGDDASAKWNFVVEDS